MRYLRFALGNRRLIAYGFLLAFASSFGQTFFIALFSGELRAAFDLGHGGFGTVYSLATLTSAATMVYAGRLIDRFPLRPYSLCLAAAMAGVCLFMAMLPTNSVAFLFLAILGLRLCGQGLMSHSAATTMARYFEAGRGRAVALASTGHASGEAVLPFIAVTLMQVVGWRATWGVAATALVLLMAPAVMWLLRGHEARHADLLAREARDGRIGHGRGSRTLRDVLRDPLFYLLLPLVMAPGFINTGVFFNQVHIVNSKGWTMELFAGGFAVYAGATVLTALAAGPLVDRLGSRRLVPYVLLPLGAGLVVLGASDAPAVAFGYMLLAGLSQGALVTISTSLWAEIYGIAHLGAIRAAATSVMVFSTALAPAIMGWLIDAGVSFEAIALGCAIWVFAASVVVGGTILSKEVS